MGTVKPDETTFMTAKGQAEALAARKISAVELLDRAIARIEALDGELNAVPVRDFDRPRGGQGGGPGPSARRTQTTPRRADDK